MTDADERDVEPAGDDAADVGGESADVGDDAADGGNESAEVDGESADVRDEPADPGEEPAASGADDAAASGEPADAAASGASRRDDVEAVVVPEDVAAEESDGFLSNLADVRGQLGAAAEAFRNARGVGSLPADDAGRVRIVCRRHAERRAVALDDRARPACYDEDHPDCRGCLEDVRDGTVETW